MQSGLFEFIDHWGRNDRKSLCRSFFLEASYAELLPEEQKLSRGAGTAVGDFWVTGVEQVLCWVSKSSEPVVRGSWEGGGDPCPF